MWGELLSVSLVFMWFSDLNLQWQHEGKERRALSGDGMGEHSLNKGLEASGSWAAVWTAGLKPSRNRPAWCGEPD